MATEKTDRYVVTLYTSDGSIVTSFWASSEDAAREICRVQLEGARTQRISKERQDGRVVARYRGQGPGSRREALVRAW